MELMSSFTDDSGYWTAVMSSFRLTKDINRIKRAHVHHCQHRWLYIPVHSVWPACCDCMWRFSDPTFRNYICLFYHPRDRSVMFRRKKFSSPKYTDVSVRIAVVRSSVPAAVAIRRRLPETPKQSLLLHRAFWRFTQYYTPTNAQIVYYILV